jgi:hypothetical protein
MEFVLIAGMGFLSLYGIPFGLLQLGCLCKIFQDENVLRNWFVIAYCQALLTYLYLAMWGYEGFLGKNFASIAITLLILGGIHGFLAWAMNRRIKLERRTSHDYLPLGEDEGSLVTQEKEE